MRSSSNLKCPESSKLEKIASLVIKPFVFPPCENTKIPIPTFWSYFLAESAGQQARRDLHKGLENGALHSVIFKYA